MKLIRITHLVVGIVSLILSGCLEPADSELQKTIDRDNKLLQKYLDENEISATETPLGYYYKKKIVNDLGNQIVNNDTLGIYYEIKTTEGHVIESYLDETKPPRLFHHNEGGLVPRAMNFASGLAKEGETFILYIPSYLAYLDYTYQQLIFPYSNLVVKVKYKKVYSTRELKALEQSKIESYIEANNLSAFQLIEDGLYRKITKAGLPNGALSKNGDVVRIHFKLFQFDSQDPIAQTSEGTPVQLSLGNSNNMKFLNISLKGLTEGTEMEMLIPSHLAYGGSVQVFPYQIRKDLFQIGVITQIARPFEPLLFKVSIASVN